MIKTSVGPAVKVEAVRGEEGGGNGLKRAIEEEMKKRKPEGELYQTEVIRNQRGDSCAKYRLSV